MKEVLGFENQEELISVTKALSSSTRIEILKLLDEEALNINEIAERLNIPASTAAMNVKMLEEAKLIRTELQAGTRGSMKLCYKEKKEFTIDLNLKNEEIKKFEIINMPIGNFTDYRVEPTCGIVSEKGHIDDEDEPRCFYNPERTKAQLLWFGGGYVEYRFSNASIQNRLINSIEFSAELCSETAFHNLDYPSEITLWINGEESGTWICPSDYGGRRGKLNPNWWPNINSQYGELKTWRIDTQATYLDGKKVSNKGLSFYSLWENPYIAIRIGIKDDAAYIGGINIFGEAFGDYPQNLLLKIEYQ